MYLWIFNLACSVVYGISRISGPNLKAVNFAKELEGKKLNGSLIKEIEVDSESSCRFECVNKERCQSYNFGIVEGNSGKFKCQISDSDRFVGFANFTEDENFIYRGIKSTCEEDDPCKENETCVVDYKSDTHICKCIKDCPAKNCLDYYQTGSKTDGVYWVYPDEEEPFQVLCDMTTDGGGWTIFQRRMDGSVDFYVDWESYKKGFGNLKGEFWLGNDYLHRLTASASMAFRIDMEDYEGDRRFAEYTTFAVANESDNYRVTIDGYRGTAGDSLISHTMPIRNMRFTTKDKDNDVHNSGNCALDYKGGWWYKSCHNANPNGLYKGGGNAQGITWRSFRGLGYSLKHTEIKIRPA
ncbi:ficolin-2-like [Pocillopora verrucosa]|uniref:ficolin-2-like n=1 Tax=Pocillopora verrucosa TaxID=203993 RepID=UPI00334052AF